MNTATLITRLDAEEISQKYQADIESFLQRLPEKFAPLMVALTPAEFAEEWEYYVAVELRKIDTARREEVIKRSFVFGGN